MRSPFPLSHYRGILVVLIMTLLFVLLPEKVTFAKTSLPYTVIVTEMGMSDVTQLHPLTTDHTMSMGSTMTSGVRILGGKFLRLGSMVHGISILPGTHFAYISDFMSDTVTKVDLASMRPVQTYTVGLSPTHIAFAPDKKRAFISNIGSNTESVLDLEHGTVQTIAFPDDGCFKPHGLAAVAATQTVYVACSGGAWIYPIDLKTLKPGRPIITGAGAYDVKLNQPRQELWVSNQLGDSVTVLDLHTLRVLATIHLTKGSGPALLEIAPDGKRVYVANLLGNSMSAIDTTTKKVIKTLPVAAQPFGPAVTPDGKYVYVPGIKDNAITIIRTADLKVVETFPAPVGPVQVAIAG